MVENGVPFCRDKTGDPLRAGGGGAAALPQQTQRPLGASGRVGAAHPPPPPRGGNCNTIPWGKEIANRI